MRRARPLLSAELVLLLGLLALVGASYLGERWLLSGDAAPVGPVAALVIAGAPMGIWFLALRAHEGELGTSTSSILWLFAVGAFIAGPVAGFAVRRAAAGHPLAAPALSALSTERTVAALAVVGLGYEAAKYLAIRYTGYRRATDDPLAILAGATAVALGVAAYVVYRELTALGGMPLGAGAARAAALPLAHAAAAAFAACALIAARTRELSAPRRTVLLAGGVAGAAAVHGGLLLLLEAIEANGLTARPGQASGAIAAIAAVALVALTLAAAKLSSDPDPAMRGSSTRVGGPSSARGANATDEPSA